MVDWLSGLLRQPRAAQLLCVLLCLVPAGLPAEPPRPNAVGSAVEVAIPVSPTSSLLAFGAGGRLGYERRDLFGLPFIVGLNLGYRCFRPTAVNVEWFQTLPATILAGYRIAVSPRVALELRLATTYGLNTLRYAASSEELSAGAFRTESAFQPEASAGFVIGVPLSTAWELRLETDYRLILEPQLQFGALALRAGVQRLFADPTRAVQTQPTEREPVVEPLPRESPPRESPPRESPPRRPEPAPETVPAPSSGLTPTQVSFSLQVYFEPDSADITEPAGEQLDRLAADLEQYRTDRIRVIGHVAAVGDPALNLPLSRERALAVRAYLISVHGFDQETLSAEGRGGDEPIADNATPEGRALNRRVEIIVDVTEMRDGTQ